MARSDTARSWAATIVGWLLVVIVGFVAFRFVIGSIFWMLRAAVIVALIIGLFVLWLKLKTPGPPG